MSPDYDPSIIGYAMAVDAIPFAFPGISGVSCLFSTSAAGDMMLPAGEPFRPEAVENRRRFMRLGGFTGWAELRQVHGDTIIPARACRVDAGDALEADGHFTYTAGLGLIIKTADCQPLLFARRDGGAVAALHVGWRANARNFPGAAVRRLCHEFDCQPADLAAVRGPSLGPAAAEFINYEREWPDGFERWYRPEDKTVNLWALTQHQLEAAGLHPDAIHSLDLCTRDMPDWFFSHRRGDRGRMVSAIWIRP